MYSIEVDGTVFSFHGPWANHVEDMCKQNRLEPLIKVIREQITSPPIESVTAIEQTNPVRCTGAFICAASGKCPHSRAHEPIKDCDDLDAHEWLACKSMPYKYGEGYELVRCEHIPTAEELLYMILAWWEGAQNEQVPTGNDDWDNMYSEEPDFVRAAKKIKEEVI